MTPQEFRLAENFIAVMRSLTSAVEELAATLQEATASTDQLFTKETSDA